MKSVLLIAVLSFCQQPVHTAGDENFMIKASQANVAEVEAAKIALSQASSEKVKTFARRMIADHSESQKELSSLATSKKLSVPASPDTEHEVTARQLRALSGRSFDSAYMKGQLQDHITSIALFREESSSGTDNEVKAYAKKYLPKLEEHYKMLGKKGDMEVH
jgi:putative membrane protein